MTGFKSKRAAALDEDGMYLVHHTKGRVFDKLGNKVNDDDTQVYGDALTIAYQSGYYDGKKAAQLVQEPVEDVVLYHDDGTRIVRIAPKRPWVDLTDNQIEQIYYDLVKIHRGAPMPWGQINFGKVLQAAIKEKNNAN